METQQNSAYTVDIEPEYYPYLGVFEFLQGQKEHGMYLRYDETPGLFLMPYCIDAGGVTLIQDGKLRGVSYVTLVCEYLWADGTPCGKKKDIKQ